MLSWEHSFWCSLTCSLEWRERIQEFYILQGGWVGSELPALLSVLMVTGIEGYFPLLRSWLLIALAFLPEVKKTSRCQWANPCIFGTIEQNEFDTTLGQSLAQGGQLVGKWSNLGPQGHNSPEIILPGPGGERHRKWLFCCEVGIDLVEMFRPSLCVP